MKKIRAIYNDVNDTKDIMQDNIDKMTQNIETAEDLEEKTNSMVDKATLFKKESKQMKKAMCWRKYKLWILIGTVVIIILIVIFIAIAIPVINLFKD
ncbi:Vesicle-associated membrane protein [Entamoeba marina]